MQSFADVIGRWPTIAEFAADIGITYTAAAAMKQRDRIDGIYWSDVARAAARRGYDGVTLEFLSHLGNAARRRVASPAEHAKGAA